MTGLINKLNKRNKQTKWKTNLQHVGQQFKSDDLASGSEDEKRMRQTKSRLLRAIKEKRRPSCTEN